MPRPNNQSGMQWMDGVLCFNLNSIANGGLRESGAALKVGSEYEPTLRLLELSDDPKPSGGPAMRFPLRGTAFLVVSLNSEVRTNSTASASEILLVRRSEMSRPERGRFDGASATRTRCSTQEAPQQPHAEQQGCPQQRCFTGSGAAYRSSSAEAMSASLLSDRRRLLEQRVGITRASSLPVQQRGVFQQQSRTVLFDFHSGCWNGSPSPAADISHAHPRFCPQHANAVHDWWFRSTPPPMLGAPPMMRFSCGCFMPPPRLDQVPVGRPSPAVPEHNIGPGARGASTD
ncbi:uncharacterized protein LOC144130343 isoform X2 [Amblyomma americanum]